MLRVGAAIGDEVAGDLVEDPLAPVGVVELGLGDPKERVAQWQRISGEIYGGIVAIVALVFLINRRYTELGLFLIAAVVVGWMVFSPDQIAQAARDIGDEILP